MARTRARGRADATAATVASEVGSTSASEADSAYSADNTVRVTSSRTRKPVLPDANASESESVITTEDDDNLQQQEQLRDKHNVTAARRTSPRKRSVVPVLASVSNLPDVEDTNSGVSVFKGKGKGKARAQPPYPGAKSSRKSTAPRHAPVDPATSAKKRTAVKSSRARRLADSPVLEDEATDTDANEAEEAVRRVFSTSGHGVSSRNNGKHTESYVNGGSSRSPAQTISRNSKRGRRQNGSGGGSRGHVGDSSEPSDVDDTSGNNIDGRNENESDDEGVGGETIWAPVSDEENGSTPRQNQNHPTTSTFESIAGSVRDIIDSTIESRSSDLPKEHRKTLKKFLSEIKRRGDSLQEIETHLRLIFGIRSQRAGTKFSVTEFIQSICYILTNSRFEHPEELIEIFSFALEDFSEQFVPEGMRVTTSIINLHLRIRIHLLALRASLAGHQIVAEQNQDLLKANPALRSRAVKDGREELLEHTHDSIQTILDNYSLEDLYEEYPWGDMLERLLQHFAAVFSYLQGGLIAGTSSPKSDLRNTYLSIKQRKRARLEGTEKRRTSAPLLPRSVMDLNELKLSVGRLRGRKSEPIGRMAQSSPLRATSNGLRYQKVPAIPQYSSESDEDSGEHVRLDLLRTSEADFARGAGLDQSQEGQHNISTSDESASFQLHAAPDAILNDYIVQEQDALDPAAEIDDFRYSAHDDNGFELEPVFDAGPQNYDDFYSMQDTAPAQLGSPVLPEEEASQIPGRSDAPSPSQKDPQSFGTLDLFADDTGLADNAIRALSRSRTPKGMAYYEPISPSVTSEVGNGKDAGTQPLMDLDEVPSSPPFTTAGKRKPDWFGRQPDAERIAMDSPEGSRSRQSQGITVSITRQARKSGSRRPPRSRSYEDDEVEADASGVADADVTAVPNVPRVSSNTNNSRRVSRATATATGFLQSEEDDDTDAELNDLTSAAAATRATAHSKAISHDRKGKGRARLQDGDPEQAVARPILSTRKAPSVPSSRFSAGARGAAHKTPPVEVIHLTDSESENANRANGRFTQLDDDTDDFQAEPADSERTPSFASTSQLSMRKNKSSALRSPKKAALARTSSGTREAQPSSSNGNLSRGGRPPGTTKALAKLAASMTAAELFDSESSPAAQRKATGNRPSTAQESTGPSSSVKRKPTRSKSSARSAKVATTARAIAAAPDSDGIDNDSGTERGHSSRGRRSSVPAGEGAEEEDVQKSSSSSSGSDSDSASSRERNSTQVQEKKRLFKQAAAVWRDGPVQTREFEKIKGKYNDIVPDYPLYKQTQHPAKGAWQPRETRTLRIALDLLYNPLDGTRFKSILKDHGAIGVVSNHLAKRNAGQLKDKARNIQRARAHAGRSPLPFSQDRVMVDGEMVRKVSRVRKQQKEESVSPDREVAAQRQESAGAGVQSSPTRMQGADRRGQASTSRSER